MAAMGFVLSSTAIVAQILEERGETPTPRGQRVGLHPAARGPSIVPLWRLVALAGPPRRHADVCSPLWLAAGHRRGRWWSALIAAGRWLLNPMFRLLSLANAREVMTAAALLVVLGAALLMQIGRALHGHGRVPGGRAPLANPPSATSSRPTSSPSAACCWGCSSWAWACRWTLGVVVAGLADRSWLGVLGLHGGQGRRHLRRGAADRRRATEGLCSGRRCSRRAASSPSCSTPPRRRSGMLSTALHGRLLTADRRAVDGADPARR